MTYKSPKVAHKGDIFCWEGLKSKYERELYYLIHKQKDESEITFVIRLLDKEYRETKNITRYIGNCFRPVVPVLWLIAGIKYVGYFLPIVLRIFREVFSLAYDWTLAGGNFWTAFSYTWMLIAGIYIWFYISPILLLFSDALIKWQVVRLVYIMEIDRKNGRK